MSATLIRRRCVRLSGRRSVRLSSKRSVTLLSTRSVEWSTRRFALKLLKRDVRLSTTPSALQQPMALLILPLWLHMVTLLTLASTEFTPQERGACHTEASTADTGRTTGESERQRLKG